MIAVREKNLLFQLHIPKSGGTSLFAILSHTVRPGRSHVAMSEQELRDRASGYALLGGHFDWDTLALFPERPAVLTVLRDPIELVLSTYRYWRAHAHEGVFGPAAQRGADEALAHSIDELLLDPKSQMRAILGIMTHFLAGKEEVAAGRGLDAALRHLDSCAWVGTTLTLERDVRVLPAMFGLKPAMEVPRHMSSSGSPQRADVGKEAMQVLEAFTEGDRILYDHARSIAEEQQRRYA